MKQKRNNERKPWSSKIEDLFYAMKEAKTEVDVEFNLVAGDNCTYALSWNKNGNKLVMEDNKLNTLTGFVYGYINGVMR